MVLKRVNEMRRSYRLHRSSSTTANTSSPPEEEVAPSVASPLRCGDVILNREGVKVGWMLDGGRHNGQQYYHSRSTSGLMLPHTLPCNPCINASYPHYWTIGRWRNVTGFTGVPVVYQSHPCTWARSKWWHNYDTEI